jgi:hypothetical protein
MNSAVGVATGAATYPFGLSNPVLWSVLAFVPNHILIRGPLSGVTILALAGILTFDTIWQALAPALSYLAIHLTEGAGAAGTPFSTQSGLGHHLSGLLVLDVGHFRVRCSPCRC